MTSAPETPPPADEPIPPLLSRGFWVMMAFCALCLLGAVVFFLVATHLRAPGRPGGGNGAREGGAEQGALPSRGQRISEFVAGRSLTAISRSG